MRDRHDCHAAKAAAPKAEKQNAKAGHWILLPPG